MKKKQAKALQLRRGWQGDRAKDAIREMTMDEIRLKEKEENKK